MIEKKKLADKQKLKAFKLPTIPNRKDVIQKEGK